MSPKIETPAWRGRRSGALAIAGAIDVPEFNPSARSSQAFAAAWLRRRYGLSPRWAYLVAGLSGIGGSL
jgi:hypothetical protein